MGPPKPRPAPEPPAGGEDALVRLLAESMRRASGPPPPGELWIGDDAAVVAPPAGPLVLATDAAVAGVHADLALVGLDDLGWKALTATVSDVAAMGARPLHALVVLCAPPGTDMVLLGDGAAQASARWACAVVGGDVTAAPVPVVSVAMTGVLEGDGPPVTRSGARPGDTILVTGPLGSSAVGLRVLRTRAAGDPAAGDPAAGGPATGDPAARDPVAGTRARPGVPPSGSDRDLEAAVAAHRRPRALLVEGRTARAAGVTAMIDVSDGLSLDLHRLADASGVGFELARVPVAPGATLEEALGGGEDYELVMVTDRPQHLARAFASEGLPAPIEIGRCTADPARRLLSGRGMPRAGWEHPLG